MMDDFHIVDGNTEPDSEVELYINNRLYAFTRADEQGNYRFEAPLTYGSSRVSVRTYPPSGDRRVVERRIQVPFHFLPSGTFAYDIQAGRPDRYYDEFEDAQYFGLVQAGYGITNWLTARAGAQYTGSALNAEDIYNYSSVSARIAGQYLINADFAPDAFYRINASAVFPNFSGFQLRYTNFFSSGFFNPRNVKEERYAGIYLPVNFFSLRSGFRMGAEQFLFENYSSTLLRAEFNTRINRLNLRLSYRDYLLESKEQLLSGTGQVSVSAAYLIPRSSSVPLVMRGLNIRTRVVYSLPLSNIYQLDFQLSRSMGRHGRFFMSTAYYPGSRHIQAQFGFVADLPAVRSTTSASASRTGIALRQQIAGSVSTDIPHKKLIASNRPMAGRASASFVLFIDNNNNGIFDDGDELLPYRAVHLDRTARIVIGTDSIIRATMLQPFFRYNVSIDRNAIPNPTLIPAFSAFSFTADPNQYKTIQVPFYRTGVIDGEIRLKNGNETYRSISGIRLELQTPGGQTIKTLRSFSDGSFYAMDIPPGIYRLAPEKAQLEILGATSKPSYFDIEIKAMPQGDYLEGLIFELSLQ